MREDISLKTIHEIGTVIPDRCLDVGIGYALTMSATFFINHFMNNSHIIGPFSEIIHKSYVPFLRRLIKEKKRLGMPFATALDVSGESFKKYIKNPAHVFIGQVDAYEKAWDAVDGDLRSILRSGEGLAYFIFLYFSLHISDTYREEIENGVLKDLRNHN